MSADDTSRATRYLAKHPELRARVESDDEFQAWRGRLLPVVIDGIPFFFPEGDIQKEEADLIVDFAIRKGMLAFDDLERETAED